jgi:hypothetical protein
LVRWHWRDVGWLTDLVRCTVIAETVKDFLRLLYSTSADGLETSPMGIWLERIERVQSLNPRGRRGNVRNTAGGAGRDWTHGRWAI